MEKTLGIPTKRGTNIAVFPTADVTLVFERITRKGKTTVEKLETAPEPLKDFSVEQYYKIETTAEYSGKIEIRVICPLSMLFYTDATKIKLWQYNRKTHKWKDLRARFVTKYNLIIGETDHLSIFGVTNR